ncbi:MAG: type II toxin-antitoxin system PemK/MazF family toxin [Candidatus Sabulitectum sp.]|nr:type II toxin-antitoxin system PemK/MazF family toxin [Candidatus Sabulitectum sp.]
MTVGQGEVYWVELGVPRGSEPGYRHPHIVIQSDLFNLSRIKTVVMCALSSNLKLAGAPGNVLLSEGEANLPKECVANISQVSTVNKEDLVGKIGTLSPERLGEVLRGVFLLLGPRDMSGILSLSEIARI